MNLTQSHSSYHEARQDAGQHPLQLWGGVECTHNRVGDDYFDQLERAGHDWRASDLERFASLGISAIRYPVLWERIAPHGLDSIDWSWADERLNRLRELNIRPIVGLVHHGSGPRDVDLLSARFVEELPHFARAVAKRFPWIETYTPVNEPLTTARFSGMYGHWHPHGRDDWTFAQTLVSQCRAIAASMRAIREENPHAQLLQTEDIGRSWSTPLLAYQAEFENERRWLSFDLLSGRVDDRHSMWRYLLNNGIAAQQLEEFLDSPCPPDVLGIDYYLASERFLDERIEHYPPHLQGSNGRHLYADVAAARVCEDGVSGPDVVLHEAWARYRTPVAVTEAHLACTREEQMRWMMDVWRGAQKARSEGVDVRAVTAWSLLGAYDWNSLVTRDDGFYESGVFDLRAPNPRPTALAPLLRSLAQTGDYRHPVLDAPGWWHRPARFIHPPSRPQQEPFQQWHMSTHAARLNARANASGDAQPILIYGGDTIWGQTFARLCDLRGLPFHSISRRQIDHHNARSMRDIFDKWRPWAVINAQSADWTSDLGIEAAEREPERCGREVGDASEIWARVCARRKIALMTFSSDQVFDGERDQAYRESDQALPLNALGRAHRESENRVLSAHVDALIVRHGDLFGPWDGANFLTRSLRLLSRGETVRAVDDIVISPTYGPDLVHAALDLLIDGESGLWHLANEGACSPYELLRRACEQSGMETGYIEARAAWDIGWMAARPRFSVLASERGQILPPLQYALNSYLHDREPHHMEHEAEADVRAAPAFETA